jgi:hypothetical protein
MRGLVGLFLCAFLLLLSSCEENRNKLNDFLHVPKASEFSVWFQWFIELFTADELSNPEKVIFILLVCVALGACAALLNSNRALRFFKYPPFENIILHILLLKPAFLTFSFRYVNHPGWSLGIWLTVRYIFLIVGFLSALIVLFYLITVLLPIAIFIGFILLMLFIISSIFEGKF